MPSAEIITIGTEILLGEIVDTNTRHIAHALREMGVDLYRTITIGDNIKRIAQAIRESMECAEIIITTGGLGPTVDDPTREAVARAAGLQTEFREELWQQVRATLARYGRLPTENQKRQAYVPQEAIAIPNPVGTAPAFIVETERNTIITLPGVPREMELLFHDTVIPYLQKRFNLRQIIKVRLIHTSGLGEGVVDIRLAAKAETEQEADRMIAEVEKDIHARLGEAIFGADADTLEDVTLATLQKQNWTLTFAGYGLTDSNLHRLSQIHLLADLQPGSLTERLRSLQKKFNTSAALGVAAFIDEMAIEIALISPHGERSHRFTYGGHPRNLPRWAMNVGLNMLRLEAEAIT
jgi:nicotinamide-nucleotide amidase